MAVHGAGLIGDIAGAAGPFGKIRSCGTNMVSRKFPELTIRQASRCNHCFARVAADEIEGLYLIEYPYRYRHTIELVSLARSSLGRSSMIR